MAKRAFEDVDSSTRVPINASHIPDDIFQAALAASRHSDEGNPYGPQPKRFMQTDEQNRRHGRELEIRKVARALRKIRQDHKERLESQKQRHPSPFETLPSELLLKLMQHTHPLNLLDLVNSSVVTKQLFEANIKAVFRGMEIEQFPEWKWFFGDSTHRTSAQSQRLKYAILSENQCWQYGKQLIESVRAMDTSNFTGMRNVMFLQDMQDRLDMDVEAIKSYTRKRVARRTAICVRILIFGRPSVLNEEDSTEDGSLVDVFAQQWKTRSQFIQEQPASIKAEINVVLKTIIDEHGKGLQEVVRQWAWQHYSLHGNHRKPQELKKWMSKVMTGLILETAIPQWHPACLPDLLFVWEITDLDLADNLQEILDKHDNGIVDEIQDFKNGVDFGQSIGLDVEDLLEETPAGRYIDSIANDDGIA